MKCPNCQGEFQRVMMRGEHGTVKANQCQQCGGFWFDKGEYRHIGEKESERFDPKPPSLSAKVGSYSCPKDETPMDQWHSDDAVSSARYWVCDRCNGSYIPGGHLRAIAHHLEADRSLLSYRMGPRPRTQYALGFVMLAVGGALTSAAFRVSGAALVATSVDPLPSTGPNIFTLILLAITYLAGTILAVLGKKLPMVLMGWGVISICLVGFAVVIFGP